ncbi:MAG TPA: low affinity iron permease family protein [Candidatus Limnocylindria bacterium]|nr:low affinity iron permease family protein [Candidatus Limnocylindria bacterium]
MHKPFAAVARWITEALASPWALGLALALIALYVGAGPGLGFPEQRYDLSFFLTCTTLLLVFVIEHQGYRERAAMQVKLDEIIRALDGDRSKIGIEERPPKEIDSVRDATRAREGRPTG